MIRLGLEHCVQQTFAEEDQGSSRPSKRLVRGGGDDVSVLEGRRDDAGGDESGDVCHVRHQVRAALNHFDGRSQTEPRELTLSAIFRKRA